MNSSVTKSPSQIRFRSEEERQQKEQELEAIAKDLQKEFESHLILENGSVHDEQGTKHQVFKVGAEELSRYLRKLGELAEEANGYPWEFPPPMFHARLQYLEIEGSLHLAKARLPNIVMSYVTILGEADFTEAQFLGHFTASQTVFSGDAYFNRSTFIPGLMFNRIAFKGHVYFSGVEIKGYFDFSGIEFQGDAYFIGASFANGARFIKPIFRAGARFRKASFSGSDISFDEAHFSDIADFEKTAFSSLSFKNAHLLDAATFQDATFSSKAEFSGSIFSGVANFGGAAFSGLTRFLDCQFKNLTIFSHTKFVLCPRFHEASLHQDTSFSGGKFASMALLARLRQRLLTWRVARKPRDVTAGSGQEGQPGYTRINWDAEARAYRTLKLLMSKFQSQHEAAHFFAGEMRSRRRDFGLRHPVHYVVSQLYDLFSEFGQSAGRVFFWLLLINAAFTYGYFVQTEQNAGVGQVRFEIAEQPYEGHSLTRVERWDRDYPWVALTAQGFNPVALLSPKTTWVQVYDGALFAQSLLQSLLNFTLLVLLAISLRGQFRRGSGGGD